MNMNHNMKFYADTRIRYFADSDSVAKEKRYKLGEWLHQEYRDKFKKAAKLTDNTPQ
ncbi:hypothetical protein MCAMS1_00180 [biofilm metagenome]